MKFKWIKTTIWLLTIKTSLLRIWMQYSLDIAHSKTETPWEWPTETQAATILQRSTMKWWMTVVKYKIQTEILVALNSKPSLTGRRALQACSVAGVDRTPLPFLLSKRSRTSSSVPISWLLGSKEAPAQRAKADSHLRWPICQRLRTETIGLQCSSRRICHMRVLEIFQSSIRLMHNYNQTQKTVNVSHVPSSTSKLCVEIMAIFIDM